MDENWFVTIGKNPQLSLLELEAQLPNLGIGTYSTTSVPPNIVEIKGNILDNKALDRFGGIIKAGKIVAEVSGKELEASLVEVLSNHHYERIDFGLSAASGVTGRDIERLGLSIKKLLRARGWSCRVFAPRDGLEVSPVVTAKQLLGKGGVELMLIPQGNRWRIGQIFWAHDFEGWGAREFDKPHVDRHRGMLPHKLARVMINVSGVKLDSKVTVFDPFCGLGAVLCEARELGCQILGSDIDQKAVDGARANLKLTPSDSSIWQADATSVSLPRRYKSNELVIVTEPDLGPVWHQDPKSYESERAAQGLAKLYSQALRNWRSLIDAGTVVVMVFPVIGESATWSCIVDGLKNLRYSTNVRPIRYSRPGQVVKRDIVCLRAE